MPNKLILKDCVITVNGVDFSDHCASVEVALKKNAVDTTNFSGGGKEQQAGLEEDQFTIEFQQDFNAAEVDATLAPLYYNETEFTVSVKPHATAVSTTNPLYSGTCILLEYMPLSGKAGDLSTTKVVFPSQRTGISRATS
jgi:hypothetical protein